MNKNMSYMSSTPDVHHSEMDLLLIFHALLFYPADLDRNKLKAHYKQIRDRMDITDPELNEIIEKKYT